MNKNDFDTLKQKLRAWITSDIEPSIILLIKKYGFKKSFPLKEHLIHDAALWHANDMRCGEIFTKVPIKKELTKIIDSYNILCSLIKELPKYSADHFEHFTNHTILEEIDRLNMSKQRFERLHASTSTKRGPKPGANKTEIIRFLLSIYEIGTEKTALCDRISSNPDKYAGEAYDFLLNVKPIMKMLRINIGADSTIGFSAKTIIKDGTLNTLRSIKMIKKFPVPYNEPAGWVEEN